MKTYIHMFLIYKITELSLDYVDSFLRTECSETFLTCILTFDLDSIGAVTKLNLIIMLTPGGFGDNKFC